MAIPRLQNPYISAENALEFDRRFVLVGRQDKDFSVAHAASAGDLHNFSDHLFNLRVVDPNVDLDLGKKGERVFAFGILVEIALLPAEAFHLADATRFERRAAETLENLLD